MIVNARATLLRTKKTGEDPLVDAILAGEIPQVVALYKRIVELHKTNVTRQYLEACLLASPDLEEISELLELDYDVVKMYRDIYYDVSNLGRLEKMDLLSIAEPCETLLKTWAMTQGLNFIAWRLGNVVDISPVDGLKDLFNVCYYKSKEAMFSGNAADSSIQATKWTKLSMDIARLLKVWVMDSGAAKNELEMALKNVNPDFKGYADLDKATDDVINEHSGEGLISVPMSTPVTFEGFEGLNDDEPVELK